MLKDLREVWESDRPMVMAPDGFDFTVEELELGEGEIGFATSGSTGLPKVIVHNRASLSASAEMVNHHLGVVDGDQWLCALPTFHVGGFGVLVRSWVVNEDAVMMEGKWNPERFRALLTRENLQWTSLVPAQVSDLVASGLSGPAGVKGIVVGGGALDRELGVQARELGWPVVQSFGMTETGSQVATGLPAEAFGAEEDGLPLLDGWKYRIGEGGRLSLNGAALASAICSRDEETGTWEKRVIDEWYESSDLVEVRSGRLYWKGRVDSLVKVLGELVSLDHLQRALDELCIELGIPQELVVIDVPSGRVRELVLVVARGLRTVVEVESIIERFNQVRVGYERIQRSIGVEEIPKSALGKVRRGVLRELLSRMR